MGANDPVTGAGSEQLARMQELATRLWSWSSRWHPGELAWFWWEHGGPMPGWQVATWQVRGRTVAWAWSKARGRLDLQVDPSHHEVLPAILGWFDATAGTAPRAVTVLDAEDELRERLLAQGYVADPGGVLFVHLRRKLSDLPVPELPPGYSLRPVHGPRDAVARAAVHRAAFPGDHEITADAYRTVMSLDGYRAGLDWLVEAPDGTPAAASLSWLDGRNRVAVLEPVGTDPAHRRQGLARAAVLASLRAAASLGASHARVCARGDEGTPAARRTYEAVGFRPYARNLRYIRES